MSFNLERYLSTSRALDVSDIDWDEAARHPVSAGEVRCLTYMMDIESHTIMYLRDLLNTRAVADPEISAFLACWVYEEAYHGRAFERVLQSVGHRFDPERVREVRDSKSLRQTFDLLATALISRMSKHFPAAYLTWGAINELSTLNGYRCLAAKTGNPVLKTILKRIIHDEARHFAFYYHQAERRLDHPSAQKLTTFLLRRFWGPVGSSVKSDDDVAFVTSFVFGDDPGRKAILHIDETIRQLPGLEWFDLLEKSLVESLRLIPPATARSTGA